MNAPASEQDTDRCDWARTDPLLGAYHDDEWGTPSHDDGHLFEMLALEGFQAGLAWITVLRKRQHFRRAFADWDVERIARFGEPDVARLLADPGIIRHRGKVLATIENARRAIEVRTEHGSLDAYLWSLVGGGPLRKPRPPARTADLPSQTPESEAMSRELRRRGFAYVGPTTCYAFMQAVGMVDDHVRTCFRSVGGERSDGKRRRWTLG